MKTREEVIVLAEEELEFAAGARSLRKHRERMHGAFVLIELLNHDPDKTRLIEKSDEVARDWKQWRYGTKEAAK